MLRARRSTLFPYTTLFRSNGRGRFRACQPQRKVQRLHRLRVGQDRLAILRPDAEAVQSLHLSLWRSEEQTSELQSRFDLVCRLLLAKKKLDEPYDADNRWS